MTCIKPTQHCAKQRCTKILVQFIIWCQKWDLPTRTVYSYRPVPDFLRSSRGITEFCCFFRRFQQVFPVSPHELPLSFPIIRDQSLVRGIIIQFIPVATKRSATSSCHVPDFLRISWRIAVFRVFRRHKWFHTCSLLFSPTIR